MKSTKSIRYKIAATALGAAMIAGAAIPAFAQTDVSATANVEVNAGAGTNRGPGMMNSMNGMRNGIRPAVVGKVTAIDGSTITVQSRGFGGLGKNTDGTPKAAATTTYTVNASGATVMKNNATSTLSAVSVGDQVLVQGTVSGTAVTATMIRDGVMPMDRKGGPGEQGGPGMGGMWNASSSPFKGNGQPIVAGTVSAVSGNTITITTSSNTSYSIDSSAAAVTKGTVSSNAGAIAIGDYIVVQGATNGTTVTASSIIDGKSPMMGGQGNGQGGSSGNAGARGNGGSGFFGAIGGFFKHLFGF